MKIVYLTIGSLSLLIGLAGVVLPGLPTVPLVLLSATCFAKGSQRLHNWLVGTKLYQRYGAEFAERGGMSKSLKIRILIISTSMMLLGLIFAPVMWIRMIILTVILIKYYIFIVRIPTV